MSNVKCDVLIIGAGPGGYAAAIRAGQLGLDTIVAEKQKPGGTCLNVGCIPSKALIHVADEFQNTTQYAQLDKNAHSDIGIEVKYPRIDLRKTVGWKNTIVKRLNQGVAGLLKRAGVRTITGSASLIDGKNVEIKTEAGEILVHCENLVIASGSTPIEIPSLPFGGRVLSSTQALSLEDVPPTMAVIGGGYIGLELGIAYAKFGSKVSVFEAGSSLLPHFDDALVSHVQKSMAALGMDIHLNTHVKGINQETQDLICENANGEIINSLFDKVLVAAGRKAVTEGFSLESLMLDMDGNFIRIDNKCQTSMRGVYAVGDVTGEPMLAHRAIAQGEMVAEIIAGKNRIWDKRVIPAICFTDPEIVTAGMSLVEAQEDGRKNGFDVMAEIFPFAANGRAMTMESEEGFIQIIARSDNHVILGIHAVGGGVSELSASFALAIEMGARLEDIAATIHAHPTMGEAFQEAAMRTLGIALHI